MAWRARFARLPCTENEPPRTLNGPIISAFVSPRPSLFMAQTRGHVYTVSMYSSPFPTQMHASIFIARVSRCCLPSANRVELCSRTHSSSLGEPRRVMLTYTFQVLSASQFSHIKESLRYSGGLELAKSTISKCGPYH